MQDEQLPPVEENTNHTEEVTPVPETIEPTVESMEVVPEVTPDPEVEQPIEPAAPTEELPKATVEEPLIYEPIPTAKAYMPEDRNFTRVGPDGQPINPEVKFEKGRAIRREDVVKNKEA